MAVGAAASAKVVFIHKVDAICKAREERLGREVEAFYAEAGRSSAAGSGKNSAAQVTVVLKILVPNLEAEVRELRALGEPSGGAIPMGEIIASIENLIGTSKVDPSGFLNTFAPYETAEKTAEKHGISRCPVR